VEEEEEEEVEEVAEVATKTETEIIKVAKNLITTEKKTKKRAR